MSNSLGLYAPWTVNGSYINRMLDCGHRYNGWVETALKYLPAEIFDEHKESLAFVSTAHMDACRVARHFCEDRELILLSERILPKAGAREEDPQVRYFIFVVLHEIVHAIMKHGSPKFDALNPFDVRSQEQEADMIAYNWFNAHVAERDGERACCLTREEVAVQRARQQSLMTRLYHGDGQAPGVDPGRT